MDKPDHLFKLRLPQAMRATLETGATARHRSLTAEILDRIEWSIEMDKLSVDRKDAVQSMMSRLDESQRQADELKAELVEVRELIKEITKAQEEIMNRNSKKP